MAKIFQVSARAGMTRVVEPDRPRAAARGRHPQRGHRRRHRRRARRRARLRRPRPPGRRGALIVTAVRAHRHARRDDGPDARRLHQVRRVARLDAWTGSPTARSSAPSRTGWPRRATTPAVAAALVCLAAGQVVSYVKARAEGLGMTCNVGIAERTERLLIVGVGGLLTGFGVELGPGRRAVAARRRCRSSRSGSGWRTCTARPAPADGRVSGDRRRRRRPGRVNLAELGYAAGWRLVRALPRPVARRAVPAPGADRAYRANGGRAYAGCAQPAPGGRPGAARRRARRAGPRGLRSYARYWLEAFRLPALSRAQILAGFRLRARRAARRRRAAGRGAVVALPHAGNWDAAGAWVAASGWPITTVAERLKPEGAVPAVRGLPASRWAWRSCRPTGGDRARRSTCWRSGCAPGTWCRCWPTGTCPPAGVEVDFFGGRTRMPAGPALLALRTGAPLYVASTVVRAGRGRAAGSTGPIAGAGPGRGALDVRVRLLTQRDRRPSGRRASPGTRRTGTCCSGCGWTRPRRCRRGRGLRRGACGSASSARTRSTCPAGCRTTSRDLAEALIALGHEVSVLAPADEDVAAAAVRGAGRPGRAGAVQRLGGPAVVRPGLRRPGAALARAPATSTCCTCTSRSRRACRCWRCCRPRGPGGGHLPHRDDPVPGAGRRAGRAAAGAGADHRPDRGQRAGPQGAGRAPRRRRGEIPNGVAVARFAGAEPLPGWPRRRAAAHRLPGPVHRAAQGLRRSCCDAFVGAGRRRGPGCGCWSPARATPTRLLDDVPGRRCATGSRSSAWSPRRTRRGCCAASTSTSRRTPAASPSA